MRYHTTLLEDWIENLYGAIGVKVPADLNILSIASKLDIWVYFVDTPSKGYVYNNSLMTIFIDRRQSPTDQWLDFLHELCHLLRHAGNQSHLPVDFVKLQESDADNFAIYASMPYSMIKKISLGNSRREAANIIVDMFNVTYEMAYQRLEQIDRRYLASITNIWH